MLRPLLVVSVLVAGLAMTGCTKKIDTSKAERSIKAGLESKARNGVTIASVTCPSDVKAQKGNNFACTVTASNGKTAKVTVVQTDDNGNVTYSGNLAPLAGR
jgi:Domain of unknown function (DUF4333)